MSATQGPAASQDTATRKQQQPLSAISIQDLNSVQLRRTSTDKGVLGGKSYGAPTRSMSMQCLSSTNEAFLNQKIDLIAELKASKDISGIKKMKVERAKMEDRQEKEFYSDVSKQFTANNYVEQVCCDILNNHWTRTALTAIGEAFTDSRQGCGWQRDSRLEATNAGEEGRGEGAQGL